MPRMGFIMLRGVWSGRCPMFIANANTVLVVAISLFASVTLLARTGLAPPKCRAP